MRRRPLDRPAARALALPRPQSAITLEWLVAGIAVALILAGLLAG